MTHLEHILKSIPDLPGRQVLDIGAGRGMFLIACAKRGIRAIGIEYEVQNVETARAEAAQTGVSIEIVQGNAENMPYPDAQFGFVNLSEVIEHVRDPGKLIAEVFRVLEPGGIAYVSVPSRFSWYDTHFHIPFVNWIPRAWSDAYIALWGRQKAYRPDADANFQRLAEMHYYTFYGAKKLFKGTGFVVEDLRALKLKCRIKNPVLRTPILLIYFFLRPWYFRAFHFLVTKP